MVGPLAMLDLREQEQVLADLNYANLAEIRSYCDRHAIPYRIEVEGPDGGRRRTSDSDRKPVVLERVRTFLQSGRVPPATCIPAAIVRTEPPTGPLGPSDRLWYRWYNKTYEPVMSALGQLTGGRFRNGALARVLIMDRWVAGEAPTFGEFADVWVAATREGRDLVTDEYAFLSDLRRGTRTADWRFERAARASRALATLQRLDAFDVKRPML